MEKIVCDICGKEASDRNYRLPINQTYDAIAYGRVLYQYQNIGIFDVDEEYELIKDSAVVCIN